MSGRTTNTRFERLPSNLIRQASDWLVLIEDESASDVELRDFGNWLLVDPKHRQAYDAVERVWHEVGSITRGETDSPSLPDSWRTEAADSSFAVPWWSKLSAYRRHLVFASTVAMTMTLALIALPLIRSAPELPPLVHETAVGEVRTILMEDGTAVTLGPRSRLSYTPLSAQSDARSVTLDAGEAYFEVSAEPSRPFEVFAGKLNVSVTGTVFDVQRKADFAQVAVAEGTVRVSLPNSGTNNHRARPRINRSRDLTSGQRVVAHSGSGLSDIFEGRPDNVGAWRNQRLVYADVPLRAIIADLERYQILSIRIADAKAANTRISGMFDSSDALAALETVTELFPIDLDESSDGSIVLRSRR
ncbi:MAG: FecR domain-containing protein [Pseudomonadota bacterium]